MNALILIFSPSGHTMQVGEYIRDFYKSNGNSAQLINLTKNENYLTKDSIKESLINEVKKHDVLFIGGPLYAGHVEHHILQVIEELPDINPIFSPYVVPFVTYGGVHTSIALEEMGTYLKKQDRISILGFKITAEHTLTMKLDKFINPGLPAANEFQLVNDALTKIFSILSRKQEDIRDVSKSFICTDLKERLTFHLMSQERLHKKHKGVSINYDLCITCKRCVNRCPVNMFSMQDGKVIMHPNKNKCILCGECFHNCPADAIHFSYLDKVTKRLKNGHARMEEPQSKIYE